MSLWWHPVLVTLGLAGGWWTAWTTQAATTDGTGLLFAGAILLVPALAIDGAVAVGVQLSAPERRHLDRLIAANASRPGS